MVVAGGITQSVMLPITGAGALYLRHRRLPRELRPSRVVTFGLWASTLIMAVATALGLFLTLRG
jgi:hypothetical protein